MPKVKYIERKIFVVEGFEVVIKKDGKDVRSDASISNQYNVTRMSKNSYSVNDWKKKFHRFFPGYDVDVLKADGSKASGQTKLSTVRDTYLETEE